jgi:hypothetical protein
MDAETEVENAKIVIDGYEDYLKFKDELLFIVETKGSIKLLEMIETFSRQTRMNLTAIKKKSAGDRARIGILQTNAGKRKKIRYKFLIALINESYIMRASKNSAVKKAVEKMQEFFESREA